MRDMEKDEAIAAMPDVSQWNCGTCENCGGAVRWRWTGLKTVAATGDERAAGKEIEPIAPFFIWIVKTEDGEFICAATTEAIAKSYAD